MASPYRISYPYLGVQSDPNGAGGTDLQEYLGRLMKLIPGEAISLYLVGSGVIPWKPLTESAETANGVLVGWTAFCLLVIFLVRVYGTRDPAKRLSTEWKAVFVSVIAFIIWVYTIGGPFTLLPGLHQPFIGSLAVLAWTFLVPFFYSKIPPT